MHLYKHLLCTYYVLMHLYVFRYARQLSAPLSEPLSSPLGDEIDQPMSSTLSPVGDHAEIAPRSCHGRAAISAAMGDAGNSAAAATMAATNHALSGLSRNGLTQIVSTDNGQGV